MGPDAVMGARTREGLLVDPGHLAGGQDSETDEQDVVQSSAGAGRGRGWGKGSASCGGLFPEKAT